MCVSFAEHVRTYGRDCDPAACVLPRIERILKDRMRRRNLFTAPPAYLGYDIPTWSAQGAFEDVVVDCYVFAVARRIESLKSQLRVRGNIDGLIARNVNNFLTERQRRKDPIGYATFGNLEAAIAELVMSGRATVLGVEDDRLRSASIVHLSQECGAASPCDVGRLREVLANAPGWDETLAGLISTTEGGRRWIGDFLLHLREAGVVCFRVSDLVSTVASRARTNWATRHAVAASELGREGDDALHGIVRLVWPDETVVVQDVLEMLKSVVPTRIAEERQQRVRKGLTAVFQEWIWMIEETGLSKPNQVDLAERLGMSDATVADYLKRLRHIIKTILSENPEK